MGEHEKETTLDKAIEEAKKEVAAAEGAD